MKINNSELAGACRSLPGTVSFELAAALKGGKLTHTQSEIGGKLVSLPRGTLNALHAVDEFNAHPVRATACLVALAALVGAGVAAATRALLDGAGALVRVDGITSLETSGATAADGRCTP